MLSRRFSEHLQPWRAIGTMPPKNTITYLSLWVSAAGIALAGTLLGGCGTTPGREEPLRYILTGVASPEGRLVAASTNYDEVALFDLAPLKFKSLLTRPDDRREKPRHLPPFPEPFHLSSPLLAFAPDGETLVAAGVAGHVVAWDVRSGAERYRTRTGEGINDLAFFPDGHAFVTAGPNIAAWTSSTGDRSPDFPLSAGTRTMSIALSPDSRARLVCLARERKCTSPGLPSGRHRSVPAPKPSSRRRRSNCRTLPGAPRVSRSRPTVATSHQPLVCRGNRRDRCWDSGSGCSSPISRRARRSRSTWAPVLSHSRPTADS